MRHRPGLRAAAAGLALSALAWSVSGCRSCAEGPGGTPLDTAAIGPVGAVDDVDFAPYLALAHAIVTHAARPDVHPPAHAGQRVFVTLWAPGGKALRATGLGATLLESVVAASEEVARSAKTDGRVEIDVLTGAKSAGVDPEMRDKASAIGLHGYLASDGTAAAKVGWVTPGEIVIDKDVDVGAIEGRTYKIRGDHLVVKLAERAGVDQARLDRMHIARFTVAERIEAFTPGAPPVTLFRGRPPAPTALTADQLLAAVRAGADYLARIVDDKGRFTYLYDPIADAPLRGYGTLRHAGAVYALMEAYEELRAPEWVAAAQRAIEHLVSLLKAGPDGKYVSDNADEEQQKAGGSGLALVALVQYQRATGDARYLATMKDLARFIVHQQYPDGHYRANEDVMREDETARGKKLKKEVSYFPGEATLGLVRLYGIDPQPQWLAAARKAADYIVDVRDARDDEKHQIHDHWMSYALHDLYVPTQEKRYADHAFKIARAILMGEMKGPTAPAPDYVGSFYDAGETTPTSTRLEALASDVQLIRFMGGDEAWVRGPAMELACFMRGQQLDDESAFFVKNPARARGGLRESLLNTDVRIDYPQHAMSGWLRLARELRDPEWGKK